MSEPNVLVNFRLDKEAPLRLRWHASDGVPGDGYKAQITAIVLQDGTKLAMDTSAILEQTAPDPRGGIGAYLMTFNGMVGFAADHPDRTHVDKLEDQDIGYELEMVHDETGRVAVEKEDYEIVERPRARASKLTRRNS
jgi:hypothetical protein